MKAKKIISYVLSTAVLLGTLFVGGISYSPSVSASAETSVTKLSADFSTLTQGAVSENDTATVNYLQERFAFYSFQHLPDWTLEGHPLMYFFERPNVNGYVVNDGAYCRLPDTAGVIHAQLDGVADNAANELVIKPSGYWAQIPTWTIDGEWIYCTAYSGENATLFRQENLMYLRGNTDSTLANIKNFDLQMDFMFKAVDGETIVDGKDNLAIIFDAATAGNVTYENQLMFAVAPDGRYFLGKPQTWFAPSYNGQFKDSAENNVTLERGKKYHLSMRHIGNNVYIVIEDEAGNQVINHTAAVPTVLSGVGGNLAITGSNAGAKYANITVTRLDDNAAAYDYSNNANGYQFGVTARQLVNWVNPYWSDWAMEYNAIYLRNSSTSFWSNKYPATYEERTYIPVDGDYDKYNFRSAQSLNNISNELGNMFTVYHDAINGGTNYFAKAPNFDSHHVDSGISGSKYGQMYLSAHGAKSVALLAYMDGAKFANEPNSQLLDQTMSLAPKTLNGRNIQTKNFRTQFNTFLPQSTKSAISLSFRSQAAGAMIGSDNHGYANKATLLLTASGWYLDTGNGDLALLGSPSAWNPWNTSDPYAGDVSVYAEVVGTTLKIKVTAATGTVLLDNTVTIPDGNSGYIYYSAVNTMGNFYSINCDRLDDNGNVIDWNTDKLQTLYEDNKILPIGHADVVNDALQMDWTNSGFEISGNISGALQLETVRTDNDSFVNVIIDGGEPVKITVPVGTNTITVADNLAEGVHTVRVLSGTSPSFGTLTVTDIIYTGELNRCEIDNSKIRMMAIGDSITAGFGINGKNGDSTDTANKIATSDGYYSYAAIAARTLGAEIDTVAKEAAPISEVHGLANKLNMRAGSPDWNWRKNQKDIIVINLGTNDEWIPGKTAQTALEDAKALLDDMRAKNPDAYIIWVYGMMRKDYEASYKSAVEYMNAKGDARVFSLEMQPNTDALEGHPSAAAHVEYANQLVTFIRQNCSEIINISTQTKTIKELEVQGVIAFNGRSKWSGNSISSVYGSAGFTVSGYIYGDFILNCSHSTDNIVRLDIILDGDADNMQTIELPAGFSGNVTLIDNLTRGEHTVQVRRASSDWGTTVYNSITYTGKLGKPETKSLRLEFIGDSITVGEGSYGWFDNSDGKNFVRYQNSMTGYAAQTAKLLNADFSMLAHCGATTQQMLEDYNNANNGYVNDAGKKDIVVINLGTNDVGYKLESDVTEEYLSNLKTSVNNLINAVIEKNGKDVCIVWCYGMMSDKYLTNLKEMVNETALKGSNVFFCDLSAAKNNGGHGEHPLLAGHTAAAAILSEFINTNCMHIVANGDVNLDTFTDIRDLVRYKKYFSGIKVAFAKQKADVNLDKVLDSADIVKLRKLLLGIE